MLDREMVRHAKLLLLALVVVAPGCRFVAPRAPWAPGVEPREVCSLELSLEPDLCGAPTGPNDPKAGEGARAHDLGPALGDAEVAALPLPARPSLPPVLFNHGDRTHKLVALTFDACSTPPPDDYDASLIAALRATRTRATLFLGGRWMLYQAERVRGLARDPLFELGIHGFRHPHMTEMSEADVRKDLDLNQKVLWALAGRYAQVFRPPFGEVNEQLVRVAAQQGLVTVNFDVAAGDSDPHATTPRLIAWVEEQARAGSVVVMHMNGRGVHTAEALPELVASLRARGYTLVTASELLHSTSSALLAATAPSAVRLLAPLLTTECTQSFVCAAGLALGYLLTPAPRPMTGRAVSSSR